MKTLTLAELPPIGQALDGGIFAGITTKPDSTHWALVLLPAKATKLTWEQALEWAKTQDGELPSIAVSTLLFANVRNTLPYGWYWTSTECDVSCAWAHSDKYGVVTIRKSYSGNTIAVRLIPLTA